MGTYQPNLIFNKHKSFDKIYKFSTYAVGFFSKQFCGIHPAIAFCSQSLQGVVWGLEDHTTDRNWSVNIEIKTFIYGIFTHLGELLTRVTNHLVGGMTLQVFIVFRVSWISTLGEPW